MKEYYKILRYDNWGELKCNLNKDISGGDRFTYRKYVFRGQEDENWKLISKFDRSYGNLPFERRKKIEKNLIETFRNSCTECSGYENLKMYDEKQILTIGQHYGLPTRLLDWSFSMYIAAFFAFSNPKAESNNAAIWIIDTEHEVWQGEYGVSIERGRINENERQKRQSGIFTLNQSPEKSIEDYVKLCSQNYDIQGALYKVLLPSIERKDILFDLDMMGINYISLFPDLEGCAKTAILQEYLRDNK